LRQSAQTLTTKNWHGLTTSIGKSYTAVKCGVPNV